MKNLSVGKLLGLQKIASPRRVFSVLALDHRQNLRRINPLFQHDDALSYFKLDVTAALAGEATAVLLDPEVSAAQAVSAGVIPPSAGLVISLESTGYGGSPTARQAQVLPGWSVEKAKRMHADAIKLLVYYHPSAANARAIEDFTAEISTECQKWDIALMLEPLSYSLVENQPLASAEKRDVVIETARRLSPLAIDVLKAEFPFQPDETDENRWQEACQAISAASVAPWILLSAAVDFETYLRQVNVACKAGASGVAVGRAVWKEAVEMSPNDRSVFLRTTARERLMRLTALCNALGRPFTDFYTAQTPFDWYRQG